MPQTSPGRKQSTVAIPGKLSTLRSRGQLLRKGGSKDDDEDVANASMDYEMPCEVKLAKRRLTETELEQEIQIVLTADDPNVSKDMVTFNYQECEFEKLDDLSHLAVHYEARNKVVCILPEKYSATFECTETDPTMEEKLLSKDDEKLENGDAAESSTAPSDNATKKLCNPFNYSERSTQTPVRSLKFKHVQTDPPEKISFSANVTQWDMYDFYQKDAEKQALKENGKENEKQVPEVKEEMAYADLSKFMRQKRKPDLTVLTKALRIAERMISQNTYDEITQDFKYWEDLSDELKVVSGSLLPLWKFSYDCVSDLAVTSLTWNPKYGDMFVASYGSHEFMQQKPGFICAFSLSNPSNPETAFATPSSAICVDIHPDYSHYLAVGLYDGNVAVYSLKSKTRKPVCSSDSWNGKHLEPIWQVQWRSDDMDGNLNFISVGGDGKVMKWTLIKGSHLKASDVLRMRLRDAVYEELDLPSTICHAGATAFHFHTTWTSVFLLGSDDGRIYRCNEIYNQGMLMEYEPHDHAVYAIRWNEFHPRIFLTGSPDCTVKIWDYTLPEPVCTFYLESPVSDVKWAPYSATVFAAATIDGKVHVYDLHINKYSPICVQVILPKKNVQLTSIAFSTAFPVIIVGDSKGCIRSLKLSPNLRKSMLNEESEKYRDLEITNLDKCLSVFKGSQCKL